MFVVLLLLLLKLSSFCSINIKMCDTEKCESAAKECESPAEECESPEEECERTVY